MEEVNQQIKLQKIKLKIIDELQMEGNLRQLATGKVRSEITYGWNDFLYAWNRYPEDHQDFTWMDLISFYNDFHKEMNEHYANK